MVEDFDFELDRIAVEVKKRKCRTVLLQFPEGLKRRAFKIAEMLGKKVKNCRIVVSGEPCFGACDLPDTDADLIVNFGHLHIPSLEVNRPVLYVEAKSLVNPIPAIEKVIDKLPKKLGVVTTAQHLHDIKTIKQCLKNHGKIVFIGKGDNRLFSNGQVLGCNVTSATNVSDKVDAFLFVGSGTFHPLAVALATSKDVIAVDPATKKYIALADIKDRVLRQRHALIEIAKNAKNFGIILSTKPGQRREQIAFDIHDKLDDKNKTGVIVELKDVTPQKLDAFAMDCWVSTACPRLAIDDCALFVKPLLTPVELDIVLDLREWKEYKFDQIFE